MVMCGRATESQEAGTKGGFMSLKVGDGAVMEEE